ncbi:MAG: hypothetical protein PHD54_04215, partial [Desulfuromonadaceae bacterium]|nr:hypothetical protein [Desulfuromonadaceae bacterium]
KSCEREGSLDGRIKSDSLIINDFSWFFSEHPVGIIYFNGQKAAMLFRRHVDPAIFQHQPQLVTLPSTSPAHAALSRQKKLERWLEVRTYLISEQAMRTDALKAVIIPIGAQK